jgi:hypothetical protein
MKQNVLQSVRKLALIKDRVDGLVAVKKIEKALEKQAQHYHLTSSFAVILFLHEANDLFFEGLGEAVRKSMRPNVCLAAELVETYALDST